MSAFNAAVLRGVPAELLLYPDENHWASFDETHPLQMPTALEAGTLNVHGLAGLCAGVPLEFRKLHQGLFYLEYVLP